VVELTKAARWFAAAIVLCIATPGGAQEALSSQRRATLEDLFSEVTIVDGAVSPSGRYLAVIARDGDFDNLIGVWSPRIRRASTVGGSGCSGIGCFRSITPAMPWLSSPTTATPR
jgi:hypothetical protein